MKTWRIALLGLLFCNTLWAQEVSPALVIQKDQGTKGQRKTTALRVTKVSTEVRIMGLIAETKMTLTFRNPNNRVLAGDFYFPLPQGAVISGYALDIKGRMVDAVVIEKQKARQVYEKIVRRGIDPGLVQWVKGNHFKTRVFPIPAKGTRTIMVKYVSDLVLDNGEALYHLPLNFKSPVKDFSIRVEVVKATIKPRILQSSLSRFRFKAWRESYIAESRMRNARLTNNMIIALPSVNKQKVYVEKAKDGFSYFYINDFIKPPKMASPKAPERIEILWDASGSRGHQDHRRELSLLKAYFSRLKAQVTVDLVLFRHKRGVSRQFVIKNGGSESLIHELKKVQYDGGTQMASISPGESTDPADFHLLFTDGISNFGVEKPHGFKKPVYVFSSDKAVHHSFLTYLALSTGGEYFNLKRLKDSMVLKAIGTQAYSFLSSTADKGEITDTYPKITQPIHGHFILTGRLLKNQGTIKIKYGFKDKVMREVTYTVSRGKGASGDLIQRFWAQKKIDDLMIFPKKSEKEIVSTGKEYGLVTKGTSLIVLDNLNQYVENRIVPPESLPRMRKAYHKTIAHLGKRELKKKEARIGYILSLWKKRVDWWNKDFKYPKDFKYTKNNEVNYARGRHVHAELTNSEGSSDDESRIDRLSNDRERVDRPRRPDRELNINEGETYNSEQINQSKERAPNAEFDRERVREGVITSEQKTEETVEGPALVPEGPAGTEPNIAPGTKELIDRPSTYSRETTTRNVNRTRHGRFYGNGKGGFYTFYDSPKGKSSETPSNIIIKAQEPGTPYLKKLKAASEKDYFTVYMAERKHYNRSPAFFLDCADFFISRQKTDLALQILSNIAELDLEDASLLRILAHRLAQLKYLDLSVLLFEEILRLRPEEPQSHRDLALVLVRRADLGTKTRENDNKRIRGMLESEYRRLKNGLSSESKSNEAMIRRQEERLRHLNNRLSSITKASVYINTKEPVKTPSNTYKDYKKAIRLLYHVVMNRWDRFAEIESITLMELNRLISKAKKVGVKNIPVDPRLVKVLDVDLRIILTWDTDSTDIDLWVTEPSGEKAYYSHPKTVIGGKVSRDFTQGYGPEEYVLKKAMKGLYKIEANYYGSSSAKILGAVTLQVDIFTNYGRPDEKRKSITLRLTGEKETVYVGDIRF